MDNRSDFDLPRSSLWPDPSLVECLFRPFRIDGLDLRNRIVMAPMTRKFTPAGVPGEDVASYYRRRAEGGAGLIITEGIYIAHPTAGQEPTIPRLWGAETEAAWGKVVGAVHEAGARIVAQLWHCGLFPVDDERADRSVRLVGPSGIDGKGRLVGEPMSDGEIAAIIAAYGDSTEAARRAGFDGVELHAAHGYLIDQFLWERTNKRSDFWGGGMVERTRFAAAVLRECRRRAGPEFPIFFRYSQWKIADYDVKLAQTPAELAKLLQPLTDAGADAFHCSTRRFWEPEFPDSDLNLAGWTKKLTGKPAITVGSVTLNTDVTNKGPAAADAAHFEGLLARLARSEFDLVAVGRAFIANPDWPKLIRRGDFAGLVPYQRETAARNLR